MNTIADRPRAGRLVGQAMSSPLRQLVRHATVFGVGAIATRIASILLLPLYTRHLTPADYGIIAIIDLVTNLMGIAAGAGVAGAAIREHCRSDDAAAHDRVWWTALVGVAVIAAAIFGGGVLVRAPLAAAVFGPQVTGGSRYLEIAMATLFVATMLNVLETYFRSLKASTFLTICSVARLVVNVAVNVVLLVWMHLGVAGILWGNLLAALLAWAVLMVAFVRSRGAFAIDVTLLRPYWKFGWPLVLFGLVSSCMHEADRYILRMFLSLQDVGLYSIAYQIGQGVNTLVIVPFATIWSVMAYEIARRHDAHAVYARVFREFVSGLALIMLAAAMCARVIVAVLAPPEYAEAAEIIPIVCLAYLFFSLHELFKVPALVAGQTTALLPVAIVSLAVNVGLNFVLIPQMGGRGAAWASVMTFAVFSFGGLLRYRRIARLDYPFRSSALVVAGMIATYMVHHALAERLHGMAVQLASAGVLWSAWAVALFGRLAWQQLASYFWLPTADKSGRGDMPPSPAGISLPAMSKD